MSCVHPLSVTFIVPKVCTYTILRTRRLVPDGVRDLRHGLDTDDALDREVCLVLQVAGKVIRAELRGGYERFVDEELCPLVEGVDLLHGFSNCVVCCTG